VIFFLHFRTEGVYGYENKKLRKKIYYLINILFRVIGHEELLVHIKMRKILNMDNFYF
jgi:hypothetical protein